MPAKPKAPARPAAAVTPAPISPCLWFDSQAEEAANFYVSVFPGGRIKSISHFPNVGQEIHGREAGSVMVVEFTINGLTFIAFNGGPRFAFNEAISLTVTCRDQAEVDYYWEKLGEGGDAAAQACGWLKDRYGLSWQIVPEGMDAMLKDHASKGAERAFAAMMEMTKLDLAALRKAFRGK